MDYVKFFHDFVVIKGDVVYDFFCTGQAEIGFTLQCTVFEDGVAVADIEHICIYNANEFRVQNGEGRDNMFAALIQAGITYDYGNRCFRINY